MDQRLVFDVGAFNGDDTAYYLAQGYRVVTIEADPSAAVKLRVRFAAEIEAGRCTILNVGVADQDGEATFYLSDLAVWNSFDRAMATREGHKAREIRVPCRMFASILREHGVPFYLKVDIEGRDHLCILALSRDDLPPFVSFEADDDAADLVRHLDGLGYRKFRLVSQRGWKPVVIPDAGSARHVIWSGRQWIRLELRKYSALHGALEALRSAFPIAARYADVPANGGPSSTWRFAPGSSGPMPFEIPGPWLTMAEFQHTWICAKTSGILESSWFDVHAALEA